MKHDSYHADMIYMLIICTNSEIETENKPYHAIAYVISFYVF